MRIERAGGREGWTREPLIVLVGVVVLAAGVWWGLIRSDAPSTGVTRQVRAADVSEVMDLLPGCTLDTCRVLARRGGFRFDGEESTLILVMSPEGCTGEPSLGLHLVTEKSVLWSEQVAALCLDPVGGIQADRTGNAFLVLPGGAHSVELLVLRVRGKTVEDFGSLRRRFAGDAAIARDLDDDGVDEILVSVNDCAPSCAEGTQTEKVFRWNGRDYVES